MLKVYCSYHQLNGTCTEEDYNDTKSGLNPSGMLLVQFDTFRQAVPFHTITLS